MDEINAVSGMEACFSYNNYDGRGCVTMKTKIFGSLSFAFLMFTNSYSASFSQPLVECSPGLVSVPCEKREFRLALEGMMADPTSGSNWYYASKVRQATPQSNQHPRFAFQPGYFLAYRIEGEYNFGTGNDLRLSWLHFQNTGQARHRDSNGMAVYHSLYDDADELSLSLSAKHNVRYNGVNLEFGQTSFKGQQYTVRFHYGFHWAQINSDIGAAPALINDQDHGEGEGEQEGGEFLNPGEFQVKSHKSPLKGGMIDDFDSDYGLLNKSHFNGLGVRGGLDVIYSLNDRIDLEAGGAAGLLAGDIESFGRVTDDPLSDEPILNWRAKQRVIVPFVDAKVAASLKLNIPKVNDARVYVGWRFFNYFDSVQTWYEMLTETPIAQELRTDVRSDFNNFAFHGPMLGAQIRLS